MVCPGRWGMVLTLDELPLLVAENQYAARRKNIQKKHTFIPCVNFTNNKNLNIPRIPLVQTQNMILAKRFM